MSLLCEVLQSKIHTGNQEQEAGDFFSFFNFSLKNWFSLYELYIDSWVLREDNLIMWVQILGQPLGNCLILGKLFNSVLLLFRCIS